MAYTPQSNQYDNTPNSTAIFDIATSYEGNQLGSASIGGTGSLVNRSVASSILYYYYAKFPFDQMTQLIGSLETTPTGYKEFFEAETKILAEEIVADTISFAIKLIAAEIREAQIAKR